MTFTLSSLPPKQVVETIPVLRQAALAHRRLAELKGVSKSIPNQGILINTLALQEAKDSSAIENIITTHDDLFKGAIVSTPSIKPAVKEVRNYSNALRTGFQGVLDRQLLTNNLLIEIHRILEGSRTGFRKLPGTSLKNEQTKEVVYTPPSPEQIPALMSNLEKFINEEAFFAADPLVKMAILHFQFESIHPFYDGNGRTGRIVNVLYLVLQNLLEIPVLYLSRYIIQNKTEYYRLLQKVRDDEDWESWILYMLKAVEMTAQETTQLVEGIHGALLDYKHKIRKAHKFYSQDLVNNLFYHPYTKIAFLMKDLKVSRLTAASYLDQLCQDGLLHKEKVGRSNYFINKALIKLLIREE
ncbi:MAG: addiction module protein [Candidatus Lambdaproteobacteria bacterium RIFOXYD1_FULL_56_27]|uniref:Addiction module protein n=1 Tax=Candidatus Lambdaproteobacteria bacterium RIFOXYD2_FULL_56_26 TaxID=1817773 RepID=A0A1F6GU63_9PROT|nr:MAG: addiction module protein [Candidatus Lambdaproteobacteria bacterium RIFOXYC1_FULL_56_13]OGH01531.1 MAG: addiction module protein [Candidatus Lambdaproteobacteria bacterium RIFOXYD2_FULL_56_26]OGH06752.1 MAG: addiction module protein [Candidatus Lambdaproteobacteria bacterium RIFOXYD1_FULL_56_27]